MAKYYTPSTGQVSTDLPSSGGVQAPTTPDASGDITALGIPKTSLQKIFFLYGLQNPKSTSTLKGLLDMVSPTASETKNRLTQQNANREMQQGLQAMDKLWQSYKKMDSLELNLIPYGIAQKFPRLAPHKADALTHFFLNIEPGLRKTGIGGRATQQEIAWFRDAMLPRPTDTDATYKMRLDTAKQRFQDRFKNYTADNMDTTPAPATVNADTSGGYTDTSGGY